MNNTCNGTIALTLSVYDNRMLKKLINIYLNVIFMWGVTFYVVDARGGYIHRLGENHARVQDERDVQA